MRKEKLRKLRKNRQEIDRLQRLLDQNEIYFVQHELKDGGCSLEVVKDPLYDKLTDINIAEIYFTDKEKSLLLHSEVLNNIGDFDLATLPFLSMRIVLESVVQYVWFGAKDTAVFLSILKKLIKEIRAKKPGLILDKNSKKEGKNTVGEGVTISFATGGDEG